MTPNPTAPSPPKSATFIQYDGLPEPIRNALLELETFIGDVDGKDTVIQTDEHTCIDDGTIDADDAVKAFNTIVAALSPSVKPTQGEIDAAAAALGLELGPPDGQNSGWTISYRPNVRWPQDYSEREQTKLRNAATLALEAALTTRPAPSIDDEARAAFEKLHDPNRPIHQIAHNYASPSPTPSAEVAGGRPRIPRT